MALDAFGRLRVSENFTTFNYHTLIKKLSQ